MKNHDLQVFTNMINGGDKVSFLLKDVKVLRATRSLATIGNAGAKVRVFVDVEFDGKVTRWDAEAVDFQVIDRHMKEI